MTIPLYYSVGEYDLAPQDDIELVATAHARRFIVLIGGRRLDWSVVEKDLRWKERPPSYIYATSTTMGVDPVTAWPVAIPVVSASQFPSTGHLWVGPDPVDGKIELATYTSITGNQFNGVSWPKRNIVSDGLYTPGSTVSLYYDATTHVEGNISLSGSVSDRWFNWTAMVKLWGIDPQVAARDNSVIVLQRKYVNNTWGDWRVAIFGYISGVEQNKDYHDVTSYTLTVEPLSQYLKVNACEPLSIGDVDLARSKTVTAMDTIQSATEDTDSDDWLAVVPPSVDASNVVDGDPNTVWISSSEPNNNSWEVPGNYRRVIEEIFCNPWAGLSNDAQWFRVWFADNLQGLDHFSFYNENHSTTIRLDHLPDEMKNTLYYSVIFCKNETEFRKWFNPGDSVVIEWTKINDVNSHCAEFELNRENGYLYLRDTGSEGGSICVWGSVNVGWNDGELLPTQQYWSGAHMSSPAAGHSLRRRPSKSKTNTANITFEWANDWYEEPLVNPGEWRAEPKNDHDFTGNYISVDLGTLGLELGQALTASVTDPSDGTITIARSSIPTTNGLLDSGMVMVGIGEFISYTGKTSTQITGVTRASPVAHALAETVVQAVKDSSNVYVAMDGWPIYKAVFKRNPGLNPHVYSGEVYTSIMSTPRRPAHLQTSDIWRSDWNEVSQKIDRNTDDTITVTYSPFVIARHVMLLINDMASIMGTLLTSIDTTTTTIRVSTAPWWSKAPSSGIVMIGDSRIVYTGKTTGTGTSLGTGTLTGCTGITQQHNVRDIISYLGGRAKLNSFEVYQYGHEDDLTSISGSDATKLIYHILVSRFGMKEQCVQLPSEIPSVLDPITTAKGAYYQVISELCKKYGLIAVEYPDCTIGIKLDPRYPGGTLPIPQLTWTRDNCIKVELSTPPNKDTSQVQVVVRDTVNNTTHTYVYPPVPYPLGQVSVLNEIVAPGRDGTKVAEREFWRIRANRKWRIEPMGIADMVWGFQRHDCTWTDFKGTLLVDGIDFEMGLKTYDCTINVSEYKL